MLCCKHCVIMKLNWVDADWPVPENIFAGTSLRTGGESEEPYKSFNLAAHVGDLSSLVKKNRQNLKMMLSLPDDPFWLDQIHSSKVICIDGKCQNIQADASYSLKPGIVCAVLTADCLPVLLCNGQGTKIAAIHAGWRGLLEGIIENTVYELKDENLLAWLGPAIGAMNFEVGNDVYDAFCYKSGHYSTVFRNIGPEKWLLNIYTLARLILKNVGVDKVYGGDFCTVSDQDYFFSYRRDGITGRMASLIWRT